MEKISVKEEDLLGQIKNEYLESFNFIDKRKQNWVNLLKIFNNLDKTEDKVSASLLISTFQNVLGVLYQDKMQVAFEPTDPSEFTNIANTNKFAEHSDNEMNKTLYRYDSLWDAGFYGRSFIDMTDFDFVRKQIKPEVINPLYFGYDPYFPTPDKWRYYWKWTTFSRYQLLKLKTNGKLLADLDINSLPSGLEPNLWSYKLEIDKSKNTNSVPADSMSPNRIYQILDHFTILEDGTRIRVWTDKNISKIIAIDSDISQDDWDITVREIMRIPHCSSPTSKVDLIEDKHRSFGVLLNLINIKAKDWATPIYEYDVNKVKDPNAFLQRTINQHIPVEALNSVAPITKDAPVDSAILMYMQELKSEAQDAVGLPSAMMGKKKMSATESAIRQQIADTVSSIDIKLLVSSEIKFWDRWYKIMNRKLKGQGRMRIPVRSPMGQTVVDELTPEQIFAKSPVVINVISSQEKEYKTLVLRRDLMQLFPQFQQTLNPVALKNFIKYFFFPQFVQDTKMLDVIYPKTMEEIKAGQENEILERNKTTPLAPTDNDEEHMYIHYRAKKTPATWAHIFTHEKQLAQKQEKQQQEKVGNKPDGNPDQTKFSSSVNVKKDERNPMETPTPLKSAMSKEIFSAGKPMTQ